MKSLLLCVVAGGLSGCLFLGEPHSSDVEPPPPDAGDPCAVRDCSPPDPTIDLGADRSFAAGTMMKTGRYGGSWLTGIELRSSDPSIVSVRILSATELELVSHRAGSVAITAHVPGGQKVLDSMTVIAVPVASIEFFYRAAPGADAPVASLAAIAGGSDVVCVRYRDADGTILTGRGQFVAGSIALDTDPEVRLSETFVGQRSACVGMTFPASGTVSLVASVTGGVSRPLPISIVAAPATVSLVAMVIRNAALVTAPDPVEVDEYIGVDVIAATSNGTRIAGLAATWTTASLDVLVSRPTEIVGRLRSPVTDTITSKAGAFTRTVTVRAAASP